MQSRTPTALLAVLLVAIFLASCGTPPWQQPTAGSSSPDGSASRTVGTAQPTASAMTRQPSATTNARQNDLATGSAKRSLDAGGVRLSINYWSDLSMGEWTAAAPKPLSLSASAAFSDGSRQDIFLSKVSVNIGVVGPAGPLKAPDPLVDKTSVTPGYLITHPSSYGQVFTVPALPAGANQVSLALTYELLIQTAPKAKTFAKQTASDTLVIAIQSP